MRVTHQCFDVPPAVGEYYVHRGSGELYEIMAVEPSGDCRVLNVRAPLDAEWARVTAAQIGSSFWERLEPEPEARAA
jgi:hypothetical protein